MAWVYIDDGFYDHPKWSDAPGDSIALWVAAIAWCNRNNSANGFIPRTKLATLVNVRNLRRTVIDLLDRHGLELADGDGYHVHDYADWQHTGRRAEIRNARAEAGRKGANRRWQTAMANPKDDMANAMANEWQTDGPSPSPSPSPAAAAATAAPDDGTQPDNAAAAAALDLFIAHKLRIDAPRSESSYRRTLLKVLPNEYANALELHQKCNPNATRDDIARDVYGMTKTDIRRTEQQR